MIYLLLFKVTFTKKIMTSENVVFGGGGFVFYFHEKSYFCSKIFSCLYFKLFHQLGQVKVCNETSIVTM